jgi:uncharacterized membrane protein YphA (DoxX/SURF4 family)
VFKAFDHVIFDSYHIPERSLSLYRLSYALFFILFGIPNYSWIGDSPDLFFNPPAISLATFFSGFPPVWLFYLLSILICVLFVLLFFGAYTKWASILLPIFIITGNSFSYSFGKIDHDLIIWIVPICLAYAGWGNAYSIDHYYRKNKVKNRSWCISLLAFFLAFAFFTAGFQKLMGGWLDPSTHATKAYVLQAVEVIERKPLLGSFSLEVIPAAMWEVLDYLTVFFELGFLIAVLKERIFKKFVVAAIFFHLAIFLTMGITTSWLYIVYLLFLDWSRIQIWANKITDRFKVRKYLNLKILSIALLLVPAMYISGQFLMEQPGLSVISPLGLLAFFFSIEYGSIFGLTSTIGGSLIGIYIFILYIREDVNRESNGHGI